MYRFNCADLKKNCLLVAGTESKYLFLENLKNGNSYLNLESQLLMDSLGSLEGQPGGSFRPLRNKF